MNESTENIIKAIFENIIKNTSKETGFGHVLIVPCIGIYANPSVKI